MVTATDQYYVGVANQVLKVLSKYATSSNIYDSVTARHIAMCLTAWFEDICTGLGIWRVVNTTCRQRYGYPLPFYDTSDYIEGEPNLQDVKVLLWDTIQALHDDDDFINPEDPTIAKLATEIYAIFDKEYDYAPETDELSAYLANPELGTDHWTTRNAIHWFALNSYLATSSSIHLDEIIMPLQDKSIDTEHISIFLYSLTLDHIFSQRYNILSLTAAEWLSSIIKHPFTAKLIGKQQRLYKIKRLIQQTVPLKDIVNGETYNVELESFTEGYEDTLRNELYGTIIRARLIQFNKKYYLCGFMSSVDDSRNIDTLEKELAIEDRSEENNKRLCKLFSKATNNQCIVFLKGEKEIEHFIREKMSVKITKEQMDDLNDSLFEQAKDGLIAIMVTPDEGQLYITRHIPGIKAPNNPYYDADYAKQYSYEFFTDPTSIDYSAVCQLHQLGYLSEAAIDDHRSYDYGHRLLQDNAQFIIDHSFSRHQ